MAVVVQPCVDGGHNTLIAKGAGQFVYQLGSTYRSGVDTGFVGACLQQLFYLLYRTNAPTHCKWNVQYLCDPFNQVRQSRAPFVRCCNIQKNQFVCSLPGIGRRQFHRVARVAELLKPNTLDRLSILDVQTGNDAFCKHGEGVMGKWAENVISRLHF